MKALIVPEFLVLAASPFQGFEGREVWNNCLGSRFTSTVFFAGHEVIYFDIYIFWLQYLFKYSNSFKKTVYIDTARLMRCCDQSLKSKLCAWKGFDSNNSSPDDKAPAPSLWIAWEWSSMVFHSCMILCQMGWPGEQRQYAAMKET